MKEAELLPASMYRCNAADRTFHEAGRALAANPDIAGALVSHRFPLEAAAEAFDTAADRQSGAIKVAFNLPL